MDGQRIDVRKSQVDVSVGEEQFGISRTGRIYFQIEYIGWCQLTVKLKYYGIYSVDSHGGILDPQAAEDSEWGGATDVVQRITDHRLHNGVNLGMKIKEASSKTIVAWV